VHAFRAGPVQVAFGTRVQRVMLAAGESKVLRSF
jgi:hypothetical protein